MSYASDGYWRVTITHKKDKVKGTPVTVLEGKQRGYERVPLYITYEGAMVVISDDTTTMAYPVADIVNIEADKHILPRRY